MTRRNSRKYSLCFLLLLVWVAIPVVGAESPIRWKPLGEPGCGGWLVSIGVNPHRPHEILLGGDVLGVGRSENRGESWRPCLGFKSIEMGDFTFHPTDPNTVWVGSLSGPYRSDDAGKTWTPKRAGMPEINRWFYTAPIEKVLYDPTNSRRLLAFGGNSRRMQDQEKSKWGAVWESTDGGEHWTEIGVIGPAPKKKRNGANVVGAAFAAGSATVVYAAAEFRGLMRSDDGGKTWTERSNGLPHKMIERVVAHPTEPETVWISLNPFKGDEPKQLPGSVFKSTDGGKTWTEIATGLPQHRSENESPFFTAGFKAFGVSPTNPDAMYAGDFSWVGARIYKTTDGGRSWSCVFHKTGNPQPGVPTARTAYQSGSSMTVLTVDPTDENTVYAAGSEYVLMTRDGGKSWEDITAVPTDDGGWTGRGYSGLCCRGFGFDPYRKGRAVTLAMDAGKCWMSTDGMKTWYFHGQKPDAWGSGNEAAFARDGRIYVTTGQFNHSCGILRSEVDENRKDNPWTALDGEKHGLPPRQGGTAQGIHTLPDDSTKVWAVLARRLYHSENSGDSWTRLSGNVPGLPETDCGSLAADPRKPTTIYVSAADGVYVTEDTKSFKNVGGPKVAGRMAVDANGVLYLAAYRGKRAGLWRYDPAAEPGWKRIKDDWHLSNVQVDPKHPNRLLVCSNDDPYHDEMTSLGVSISADGGETWSDENTGLPVLRATGLAFDPFDTERIVVGTGGCGYFLARWPTDYRPKGPVRYEHTKADTEFSLPSF